MHQGTPERRKAPDSNSASTYSPKSSKSCYSSCSSSSSNPDSNSPEADTHHRTGRSARAGTRWPRRGTRTGTVVTHRAAAVRDGPLATGTTSSTAVQAGATVRIHGEVFGATRTLQAVRRRRR